MYSRYKVRMPSPPPDYAGTAFPSDGGLPSGASASEKQIGEGSFQPTVGLQDSGGVPLSAQEPDFAEPLSESGEIPTTAATRNAGGFSNAAGTLSDSGRFPGAPEAFPENGGPRSRNFESLQTAIPLPQGDLPNSGDGGEPTVSYTVPLIGDGSTDYSRYEPNSGRVESPSEFVQTPTAGEKDTDMKDKEINHISKGNSPLDLFSLLEGLNLDDLLFMGAMLSLLSGNSSDDSLFLISYLLTCGL